MLAPWKKCYDKSTQHIKKQRPYFADKGLSSQSNGFSSSRVWMWELDYKEGWAPSFELRCCESPLDCQEIKPVNPKGNQSWIFIGRTVAEAETPNNLATWCKELTHWKRPWCWERLKSGEEGDDGGWDGWMASLTQWTWVWVSSRCCWWTGKPGVLQFMRLKRVRHNWVTEMNWTGAQLEKNPIAMQETWVRSLGWKNPLEKGKATHSSILVWRIARTV